MRFGRRVCRRPSGGTNPVRQPEISRRAVHGGRDSMNLRDPDHMAGPYREIFLGRRGPCDCMQASQ